MKNLGRQFGIKAKLYAEHRRGYPSELLYWLQQRIAKEEPILDLGCGTGISTRQLQEVGFANVVGCDDDKEMLKEANSVKAPSIKYIQGDANHLPFAQGEFGAVTSFTAFHWFATKECVEEIRRVLKPKGVFLIVNKEDGNAFRKDFDKLLARIAARPIHDIKRDYHPEKLLEKNGFHIIDTKTWGQNDAYDLEGALSFCQTLSSFAHLTLDEQQHALPVIEEFLKKRLVNGQFVRKVTIKGIMARSAA